MEVGDLIHLIREIDDPAAQSMVDILTERLQNLVDIGLEYLSLNRETDTLSGNDLFLKLREKGNTVILRRPAEFRFPGNLVGYAWQRTVG